MRTGLIDGLSNTSFKNIQLDPGFRTKTSQIQLKYGLWVNLIHFGIGLAFGLATVQVSQLSNIDSDIIITRNDASWIASVLPLFSSLGCLISGIIMDRMGRRVMLVYCQVPTFIGWIYTSIANTPKDIIIGRAITGFGCGMSMCTPRVYCTEIALPNMRGVIGAFPAVAFALGMAVQAGLGKFFAWQIICYISGFFSLINFCLFNWLPETPYYILKTKTVEEARANLAKFRGPHYDLDNEMEQLIEFKRENDIRKLTFLESMAALLQSSSCKPFWLIFAYVFISQASGVTCVFTWSIEMLKLSKTSYDIYSGNIMMAGTRVLMTCVTSIVIYRVGRRTLALISAFGVAVMSFALAVYLHYNQEPSLIPLLCLLMYLGYASLGYYPLPILMASELFPLQVRGLLNGVIIALTCLLMFGSTNLCQYMMDNIGLGYTFIAFGGSSLLGTLFLYLYLPETKDLTLQEIEEYYREIRPTLVSQRLLESLSQLQMTTIEDKNKTSLELLKRSTSDINGSKNTSSLKLQAQRQLATLLGRDQPQTSTALSDASREDSLQIAPLNSKKSRSVTFTDQKGNKDTNAKTRKKNKKESEESDDNDQPSTSKKNT